MYLSSDSGAGDNLPSLLSLVETLRLPQTGDGSAFSALGTRSMKDFNTEIIDLDDVKYYSWGASFEPGLLDTFKWPHSVILAKEGPNDGLVSVHSARWGEYRGTLLGVNHLDL
jgi:triacylglycerol lipase